MDISTFNRHRRDVTTARGRTSYVEFGTGKRTALFVHGVGTGAVLWRNVIEALGPAVRCLALDLPLHGGSPAAADQEWSLSGLAETVADFCDALELGRIDLVGNDTGGAVAQLLAARYPELLRTLTLTNCDASDNLPPEAFRSTVELAEQGRLAPVAVEYLDDLDLARATLSASFEHPERLTDEVVRAYLEPVFGSLERARMFERLLSSLDAAELVAAEAGLRALRAPTLVVWGTGDPFFGLEWAYWLQKTMPAVTKVVEVPGGRLFFPEERPEELAGPLLDFWRST